MADTTTYKNRQFEIDDAEAIIRDKRRGWKAIQYGRRDDDLPTKNENGREVPDKSFVGKNKLIPFGAKVKIDDVFILEANSKTAPDKIRYVHCVGYGWTSVGNIKGELKNESVGVMVAVKSLSNEPSHFTVAVKNAVILTDGNRYPTLEDKSRIPKGTEVVIEESFVACYLNNTPRNLAKVTYGGKTVYTSSGNFPSEPHDVNDPKKRKITDIAAYIREAVSSYIPETGKRPLALGTHIIIGNSEKKETGVYVEVFEADKQRGGGYSKGELLGWTNRLNLTEGFHTDLKGLNAMWNQVIPDQRYDRAKGKDTEGVAKFTGNEDMIKVVDSKGHIEHVAKEIWSSFKQMLDTAQSDGQNLLLNVGFRDWAYQQAMVDGPWAANPPGYSSHQRGVAVDLNNKTKTGKGGINWWMERNAYRFGFVKTYQKFNEGHHWEYRPEEIVAPFEIEKGGKKYMKYTFATYTSTSTHIWERSHVLDPIG